MVGKELAYLAQRLGHTVVVDKTTTKNGYIRNYIRQIDEKFYTKASSDQSEALRELNQIVWGGK